jgi:hypothetical protein
MRLRYNERSYSNTQFDVGKMNTSECIGQVGQVQSIQSQIKKAIFSIPTLVMAYDNTI